MTEKEIEHYEAIIKRWQEKYAFVEKELLQTKKNFKNSQIHSKNCYKKLKEKYEKLERAYKNNEVMTRDLNELINRNLELKDELNRSQETISAWMKNNKKLIIDNGKMKKAIKFLKDKFKFELGVSVVKEKYCYSLEFLYNNQYFSITKEDYELLKSVLEEE